MKATVEIPDDLYRLTRIKAAEEGVTIRSLVVRGLRQELGLETEQNELPSEPELDEQGWPVRRTRNIDRKRVTNELVNRLRETEGV